MNVTATFPKIVRTIDVCCPKASAATHQLRRVVLSLYPMTEFIAGVPIPLLFLVHLHLLEYPLANNPEYDHNLFDPNVRGLRDRTKSMEDVCYFLVGKVGHRKETAKAVSSNYMTYETGLMVPTDSSNVPVSCTCRHDCVSYSIDKAFRDFASECYSPKDRIRICDHIVTS